ncbi:hypothetical protein SALBM135S_07309 [Streptomyces alboniger]
MQDPHRTDRHQVVVGEHGVGPHPRVQHPRHGLGPVPPVPAAHRAHQGVRGGDPGPRQLLAPALEAQVGGAVGGVGAGAEVGDVRAAPADQVAHRRAGRGDVVDRDVVVRQVVLALAEQDERHVVVAPAQIVLGQFQGAEDQAVDHPGPEPLADQDLLLPLTAGVVEQHGDVVLGRRVDHRAGQLGEVGVAEFGDGERDDAGAPFPQVTGGQVGPVTQLVDGLLHTCPHRRGDVLVLVHHVRDGLDRDARVFRDVLETHPHVHLPASR